MMKDYGKFLRNSMTETFGKMLKPARLIAHMERAELSERSGVSEDVITAIETGKAALEVSDYLAMSLVFGNLIRTDYDAYKAVESIMTPEFSHGELPLWFCVNLERFFTDRTFSEKWFATFSDEINQLYLNDETLTDNDIEFLTNNYKIIIDETAVTDENFPILMSRLESFIKENHAPLIIPVSALEFLGDKSDTLSDPEEDTNLNELMKLIERKTSEGFLRLVGSRDDGDTGTILREVFDRFRNEYRFALITQDSSLVSINDEYEDEKRKAPVLFFRIDDTGDLSLWNESYDSEYDSTEDIDEDDEDHLSAWVLD